jgi:hypothetical protein
MTLDLEKIKNDFRDKSITCPREDHWAKISVMLGEKSGSGPEPLILGNWSDSDEERLKTFFEQLEVAQEAGILPEIMEYLDKLSEDEFYYTQEFYERDQRAYLHERLKELLISRWNQLERWNRLERVLLRNGAYTRQKRKFSLLIK